MHTHASKSFGQTMHVGEHVCIQAFCYVSQPPKAVFQPLQPSLCAADIRATGSTWSMAHPLREASHGPHGTNGTNGLHGPSHPITSPGPLGPGGLGWGVRPGSRSQHTGLDFLEGLVVSTPRTQEGAGEGLVLHGKASGTITTPRCAFRRALKGILLHLNAKVIMQLVPAWMAHPSSLFGQCKFYIHLSLIQATYDI